MKLSWDVLDPFCQSVTVSAKHLDDFGHTNNVVYLDWLQEVAWAHSNALGLTMADYRRIGTGCVVRRHEIDYLAATHLDDELQVATWIKQNNGKLDMWRGYQIIRAADQKTVLRGQTQWICVDMRSGRPKRQPPEFIETYTVAEPSTTRSSMRSSS